MGQIPADGEQQHISNPSALGDDQDGTDDEDGVSIPVLTKGQTATISVNVTEPATGSGSLMAWLDWDGNGQFDADKVISDDLQDTDGDGDINLSVSVPANSSFTNRLGDEYTQAEGIELRRSVVSVVRLLPDEDAANGHVIELYGELASILEL